MKIELYGMQFEAPGATYYLWSPWRCSAMEHRLFETIRALPGATFSSAGEELAVSLTDPKAFKASTQSIERVMKGWQEEASDTGTDRRAWRWMLEADTDAHGYDHAGERASVWAFLRVTLEHNVPAEGERAEEIDLNGFGLRIWRNDEVA